MKSAAEKHAEALFRVEKARMLRLVGHRRAMYASELEELGRSLFGTRWIGVHNQASYRPRKGSYAIVNTAYTNTSPGIHWIAAYCSPAGVLYLWDSFGRPIRRLAWRLLRGAENGGLEATLGALDEDAQQRGRSEVCGQLCLAWLQLVHSNGIKVARLV